VNCNEGPDWQHWPPPPPRARLHLVIMSSTPHLNLLGANHLTPLARPIKPTQASIMPAVHQHPRLPSKIEAVTARLAARSQHLGLINPNRSRPLSPNSTSRSVFSSSYYSTRGIWPSSPQPTVARIPQSTLFERRSGVPTSQWHTPASPEFVPTLRLSPEEIFAWRRGWQPNDCTGKLNLNRSQSPE
jgi:hypothetical protein